MIALCLLFCLLTGQQEEVAVPQAILSYNENMGGVDLHNQHRSYHAVGRPGRKWWRYIFWFLVQTSIINTHFLFKTSRPADTPRRQLSAKVFRLAIFDGLVKGNATSRRQAQMQPAVAARAVTDPSNHPIIRMPGRKKNCIYCQNQKVRTSSGRGVQTVWGCPTCKINLCKGLCFAQFHHQVLL